MLETMINQGILFYVIAGVCGAGVLTTLLTGFLYGRLARDAKNMTAPKTKLMKQIKNKFENSYRLKESVHNVSVFVENCLGQYKVAGLTLHRMKRLSYYAMGICTILSCAGIYLSVRLGSAFQIQINYMAAGVAAIALIGAVRGIMDTTYKQQQIMVNVRDYLENSLLNRLLYDQSKPVRSREKQLPAVTAEEGQARLEAVKSERASGRLERAGMTGAQAETAAMQSAASAEQTAFGDPGSNSGSQSGEARAGRHVQTSAKEPARKEGRFSRKRETGSDESVPVKKAAQKVSFTEKMSGGDKSSARERLKQREVQENVDKMKESMNQIAAGNAAQRQKNREILKSMDAKEQEEVIREILKEFLS